MLTIEDCIALSDLTENEIMAIAEHEHVPEMIALELGHYLLRRDDGQTCIKGIILDDIRQAEERGDKGHATRLKLVLRHFMDTHRDQGIRLC